MNIEDEQSAFDRLPRFDARDFEPPAWAHGPQFQWDRKNGESSTAGQSSSGKENEDSEEEEWEDARDNFDVVDADLAAFTIVELKVSS